MAPIRPARMTCSSSSNAAACQRVAATMSSWPRSRRASELVEAGRPGDQVVDLEHLDVPAEEPERGVDLALGRGGSPGDRSRAGSPTVWAFGGMITARPYGLG